MTEHNPNGWEPDPRKMGNWRAMFESPRRAGEPPGEPTPIAADDGPDADPNFDAAEYRPWILQRSRTRPPMMLEFRRYEPRSGLWTGWAVAYPHFVAVEYTGDRMVSLDFGTRQVVIEGHGLDGLVRPLQEGLVQTVLEYCPHLWPSRGDRAAVVTTIRRVENHA